MKKLFILLLSAVVAVSASAQDTPTKLLKKSYSHKNQTTKVAKATCTASAVAPLASVKPLGSNKSASHIKKSDKAITWDFEDESQFDAFTCIDNDGDGYNWIYQSNLGMETERKNTHSGDGLVYSESYHNASYDNDSGLALNPDNWLISPEVTLGGVLSIFAVGQDVNNCDDVFGVYVCVGDYTGVDDFVQVAGDFTTTGNYQEFEIDLSAYQGKVGHFAIVHHNVYDQFILNIDDITLDVDGVILPIPTTPVVTVDPAAITANVTWSTNNDADKWNLRYRPVIDLSDNPIDCHFSAENYTKEREGWDTYDADGDGYNWGFRYADSENDYYLFSESFSSNTLQALNPDNYLYSPETKLEGILRFTYWEYNSNGGICEKFMVYAMIGEEMIPLADEDFTTTNGFETKEIDLSRFGGQRGRIVFRHYNSKDQFLLCLDDIFIGDPEAEIALPADWTEVNGLTEPNYTIHGLTLGAEYEVQVMGYNDEHESDWSKIVSFTTKYERGDVNYDDKVDIADVTALVSIILGNDDVEPYLYNHVAADTNRDKNIRIDDVTTLVKYILNDTWPEMVYTIVGPENVFGSNWDATDNANNLVKGADGTYTWTKKGVTLSGNFEFQIVGDHDNSYYEWPVGNCVVTPNGEGKYDIVITFNPEAEEAERITYTLTKHHVYTVVGEPANMFYYEEWNPNNESCEMKKGDDGIYRWENGGIYLAAGTDTYFKVIQDGDMDIAWPEEGNDFRYPDKGWWFFISETGVYDFIITFNPSTGEITFVPTKVELPE